MFQKILVPLDGSDLAEAALAPALELAGLTGGRLVLLRVVPPPPALAMAAADPVTGTGLAAAYVDPVELVEVEEEVADEYLRELRGRLPGGSAPYVFRLRQGEPAREIVSAAEAEGADLIAMSTHGRAGLERLFLGSVADEVLRRTHIPLLLLRPAEDERDAG
jgi:nucleotide-binding universal stress UspA family protein